ncbi:ATP-binding protein [Amycolatopsis saalfeldensis]|uniref:DNA topoisomerase (ATP-hydrolyzing) n=1 Tax=Amycolatopsis saalfeldensis TaxID=394193 RepID=A0A1H8SV56_9PSEU|nr:ATP-binding protein [Amycolatopsis saalfeldensis]SEO82405.1 DNA gyrase subunit B [Amycolatopsis saalfeldensis]
MANTHDWSRTVDLEHLESIRRRPDVFAPGGARHLLLEVLAYPSEEAEDLGTGRAFVTFHPDGSISVTDEGRGTVTQVDGQGRAVRKPVMATRDLRFFDSPTPPLLPDGHPRRGMSVVAALSVWLVHTNRRGGAAWTQRYERGVPVTDLTPVPVVGPAGTTVRFLPDPVLAPVRELGQAGFGPHLALTEVMN